MKDIKETCPSCGQEVVSLEGMSDHQKFRLLMKEKGWNLLTIAEITGRSHDSIRGLLKPSGEFPVWLKVAIKVWESGKK